MKCMRVVVVRMRGGGLTPRLEIYSFKRLANPLCIASPYLSTHAHRVRTGRLYLWRLIVS